MIWGIVKQVERKVPAVVKIVVLSCVLDLPRIPRGLLQEIEAVDVVDFVRRKAIQRPAYYRADDGEATL